MQEKPKYSPCPQQNKNDWDGIHDWCLPSCESTFGAIHVSRSLQQLLLSCPSCRDSLGFRNFMGDTIRNPINFNVPDVGVGVGRNLAVDAVTTEFMFLLDDDHVVTPNLKLDELCQRFANQDVDILGVRQGFGSRSLMLSPLMNGKRVWSGCRRVPEQPTKAGLFINPLVSSLVLCLSLIIYRVVYPMLFHPL